MTFCDATHSYFNKGTTMQSTRLVVQWGGPVHAYMLQSLAEK